MTKRNPIKRYRHYRHRRNFHESVSMRMAQESLTDAFYGQTNLKTMRKALQELGNNDKFWNGLEDIQKFINKVRSKR